MQILLSSALALVGMAQATTVCSGTFSTISAAEFVSNLHPGWNLGNNLDAVPDEGSWNNMPVVASTVDTIKDAGFRSVRLPVTWAYHFTGGSPNWTVDPAWLQRVSDVVDMIVARGIYAIVDVHHVAFEPINEPPCNTAVDVTESNKLNNIFLQAINDAGGFNSQRIVNLVGGASYLSKHLSSTTTPGIIATLTLRFSGGDSSPAVQIVQWKAPTLSSTSAVASTVSGSALSIPITWGGLSTVAALKALTKSGTYLVDDWTVSLSPIQQARVTYSNQYNWDDSNVILTSSAISCHLCWPIDRVHLRVFPTG
ncbi:hypothetical protein LCP963914a_7250 [Penicillium roqueforti]|nr:hypothetical protein LCP963914a_7250 [Penicillium roqueforti]KAI2695798.1 hypothetical protein CBS147372_8907 [Penicillium roqueforti]KAI2714406.1 hypothetical protein CBS147318_6560 [Penicillium roqueforti]KAI2736320.1 hypothetical protein DTO012A1_8498 [Penicillium roqueforti]KAI3263891.1 hypothetical protein CBS147308_8435 [Penicillium roqueforti]